MGTGESPHHLVKPASQMLAVNTGLECWPRGLWCPSNPPTPQVFPLFGEYMTF